MVNDGVNTRLLRNMAWGMFLPIALFLLVNMFIGDMPKTSVIRSLIDLEEERNITTWFASILWFLVAAAAVICYILDERRWPRLLSNKYWLVIAVAFLFASIDDTAMFHEHLTDIRLECATLFSLHLPGFMGHWVSVYCLVLPVFGLSTAIFFAKRLKGNIFSSILIGCGALCYSTSIGMNVIGHSYSYHHVLFDNPYLPFRTFKLLEEILEDVGTAAIVLALARYAQIAHGRQRQEYRSDETIASSISPGAADLPASRSPVGTQASEQSHVPGETAE